MAAIKKDPDATLDYTVDWSDWLAPLADVMNREGITDRPLSVEVCEVNGQPHYIVNMMDSSGGTQSVTLNARGGSQ